MAIDYHKNEWWKEVDNAPSEYGCKDKREHNIFVGQYLETNVNR